MSLTYQQRAEQAMHPLAKKLLKLMEEKKTNLALSADVTQSAALIDLAETLGDEVCVLKTHIDILEDFTPAITQELQRLADRHQFILFEDRKFADMGNTAKHQYEKGVYRIAEWAPIVNAHPLPGPGIVEGLKMVGGAKGNGLLLLAEMSTQENYLTPEYTEKAVALARQNADFVIGFIAMRRLTEAMDFVYMTPGVKFEAGKAALGQHYLTPETVIKENGSDIIIVGRGIYQAENPVEAARQYREAGWAAYQARLA